MAILLRQTQHSTQKQKTLRVYGGKGGPTEPWGQTGNMSIESLRQHTHTYTKLRVKNTTGDVHVHFVFSQTEATQKWKIFCSGAVAIVKKVNSLYQNG